MLCDFCGGVDLNTSAMICHLSGLWPGDRCHVHRQDLVCATDGLPALDNIFSHRQALPRRPLRQVAFVCAAFSSDGICSTGLPREFARHRSLFGRSIQQAPPHGLQSADQACNTRRCQRETRLAYLWLASKGLLPTPDRRNSPKEILTHAPRV